MPIAITEIFSSSWNVIYNSIIANVSNPGTASKFIFSSEPDQLHPTKDDYPIVVINPVESDLSETLTVTQGTKVFPLRLLIDVFSTKNEQLDTVSDDVFDAVESKEQSMHVHGLYNFSLARADNDTVFRGKIRVHRRTFEWKFNYNKVGA